jgi:hypothetical protein
MMKKMILLSVLAVSLTGCIVSPYDDYDHHRHSDRNAHHDRQYADRDWNKQHRHWDDRKSDRYDKR